MSAPINNRLEQAFSRLPHIDTRPFGSVLNQEGYSLDQAFLSITGSNLLFALHRAVQARKLAVSYRNFNVGASVMTFKLNPPESVFYTGINIKPEQESVINVHAEQLALQKIKDFGGQVITMVAVVGELQADTQSGRLAETLHPCGLCRDKLADSGLLDQKRSLIVSALPDLRTIEMYSPEALNRFHDTQDDSGIFRVNRLPEMELLTPFVPSDTQTPITLRSTPQQDYEEDIWLEAVGIPLVTYSQTGSWPIN